MTKYGKSLNLNIVKTGHLVIICWIINKELVQWVHKKFIRMSYKVCLARSVIQADPNLLRDLSTELQILYEKII